MTMAQMKQHHKGWFCDDYEGDLGYTKNSAEANRILLVTNSLIPTPVASDIQGNTNIEEKWMYTGALPDDLTIPHPDSRQRVPLYS